jgi:hypothetical protein
MLYALNKYKRRYKIGHRVFGKQVYSKRNKPTAFTRKFFLMHPLTVAITQLVNETSRLHVGKISAGLAARESSTMNRLSTEYGILDSVSA